MSTSVPRRLCSHQRLPRIRPICLLWHPRLSAAMAWVKNYLLSGAYDPGKYDYYCCYCCSHRIPEPTLDRLEDKDGITSTYPLHGSHALTSTLRAWRCFPGIRYKASSHHGQPGPIAIHRVMESISFWAVAHSSQNVCFQSLSKHEMRRTDRLAAYLDDSYWARSRSCRLMTGS